MRTTAARDDAEALKQRPASGNKDGEACINSRKAKKAIAAAKKVLPRASVVGELFFGLRVCSDVLLPERSLSSC